MPSSATITAFYSFSANTKARANQVNNNFSNYRGHIIAIDPNTATAATTETYDLGSTEYRWRTGYFREVDFKSNTSTGQALQIVGDTAAGTGAFNFHIGSTIAAQISNNGFSGNLYGQLTKPLGLTTAAGLNQIAKTMITSATYVITSAGTAGAYYIAGSTLTITTIGRPIEYLLSETDGATLSSISVTSGTVTVSDVWQFDLYLYRNGTAIRRKSYGSQAWTSGSLGNAFPFNSFNLKFNDYSCPSGSNTYYLAVRAPTQQQVDISYLSIYLREI